MLSLDGDDVVGRGRVSGHVDGEQLVLVGVGRLCAAGEMGDGLGLLGHGDGDGCRHLRGVGGRVAPSSFCCACSNANKRA